MTSRHTWGAALALAAIPAISMASGSRILFRDSFDGTAERPAGLTGACAINEAPPSLKSLGFNPKDGKPSDVYTRLFTLPAGTPLAADYAFSFRFAFPPSSRKALTLTLASGEAGQKKLHQTVVTLSEKAMSIRPPAAGLLPPMGATAQDTDLPFMPPRLWHKATVRVQGTVMELWVEYGGVPRKVALAEVPTAPLVGFNFSGATAFSLDDIEVRRLDALPAGDFSETAGLITARRAAEHRQAIPSDATSAKTAFRLGNVPGAMALKLGFVDGSERIIDVKTMPAKYDKPVARDVPEMGKDGKLAVTNKVIREPMVLPDAGLVFRERNTTDPKAAWTLTLNTRPSLKYRYEPEREAGIVNTWTTFPAASERRVAMELRPGATGTQLWLEGRYAGFFASSSRLASVTFTLPAGGSVSSWTFSSQPLPPRFLPLDVAAIANPGAMADAKVSIGPGEKVVETIPFTVAPGAGNADLGVCREGLGSFALECDGYLSRTPFDGMPENLMWSVPVAQYHKAWLLCAVEDDPDKVPVVTARLTKFVPGSEAGRGPAIADTELTLPRAGQPLPENVKRVGEVATGGRKLPLYLVECPIDSGNIQEILYQEKPAWLDFEVLGKRNDKDNFYMDRSRKPADEPSGVHVFAATLERPPVEMFVEPDQFGNIYQPGEKPGMKAMLKAVAPSAVRLDWAVRDLQGTELEKGSRDVSFAKAGEEQSVQIPFSQSGLGWYGVDFALAAKDGTPLLRHTASFANIPADTRQAGYESPYFTWNFRGPHGTIRDIAVSGPLLLKAGIRHTHVDSEQAGAPWKLTMGQLPRMAPKSTDPAEAAKEMEALIRDRVAKFPHATMALIFHESGGGPFPLELLGGKTELGPEQAAYDKAKMDQAVLIAKAYRKVAPQIRLVVGNSGTATPGLLASLFRAGIPRDCIDFIGEESVGMTMPPELSVAKENWILRETARVFGYGDIPVSACYEWKCRRSRHLGLAKYAEFNVRDILIGHAWRQPLIPTVGLPDVASSYYNTVWGDEAFTHYPQVYPKPSYPAVSTATLMLDGARFVRMLPTGSLTAYALEFQRGKDYVTTLWTARGEVDATLAVDGDEELAVTTMLGSSSTVKAANGSATLPIGEAPVYVVTPAPLKSVAVPLQRRYAREAVPANLAVVTALSDWTLTNGVDPRLDVPAQAPVENRSFRRAGTGVVRAATDDVKGPCLEVEWTGTNACPDLMQEYLVLRPPEPIAVTGTPSTIGVWVKGNSSWGKVFWELTDADGERWLSAGSGGYGCDVYDWPEQAGINFDGWHFLQFPIAKQSPIRIAAPGQDAGQWQHDGTGNRVLDYPVKVSGLAVSMPRRALNLLEMEPVSRSIRLKDLGVY